METWWKRTSSSLLSKFILILWIGMCQYQKAFFAKSPRLKNVCFCVVTEVCGKSAVFHVSFQFNDRLFGARYFVFHARDVITINHYWEKYTSLPSFQIKEQNRWEISSLEQNYKVTYHTITSLWVVFGLSRPSTYLCVLDKHVMVDPTPALLGVNPHN